MSYRIEAEDRKSHLYIRIMGTVGPGQSERLASEVFEAYRRNPLPGALVDVTALTVDVSPVETVNLVSSYYDLGLRLGVNTAVLFNDQNHEAVRFYETVARNRGYPTQMFSDAAEALKWLEA